MKLPSFLSLDRGGTTSTVPQAVRGGHDSAVAVDEAGRHMDVLSMPDPGAISAATWLSADTFADVIARREPYPRDDAGSDATAPDATASDATAPDVTVPDVIGAGSAAPIDLPAFLRVLPTAGAAVAVAAGREPIMATAVRRLADTGPRVDAAVSSRAPSLPKIASFRLPAFLAARVPREADGGIGDADGSIGTSAVLREGLQSPLPSRSTRRTDALPRADEAILAVDPVRTVGPETSEAAVIPPMPASDAPATYLLPDPVAEARPRRAETVAPSPPAVAEPAARTDRALATAMATSSAPSVPPPTSVDIPKVSAPAGAPAAAVPRNAPQTPLVVGRSPVVERASAGAARSGVRTSDNALIPTAPTYPSDAVKPTAEGATANGSSPVGRPDPIRVSVSSRVEGRPRSLITSMLPLGTLPSGAPMIQDPGAGRTVQVPRSASPTEPPPMSVPTAVVSGIAASHINVTTEVPSDAPAEPVGSEAWQDQLGAQLTVMANGDGVTEAVMKLAPEELGELEIRVVVRDGEAALHFGATNADTRQAIENAQPRLRELFASQDMAISNFSVFSSLSGNPQSSSRPGDAPPRPSRAGTTARAGTQMPVTARVGHGIVDLYA